MRYFYNISFTVGLLIELPNRVISLNDGLCRLFNMLNLTTANTAKTAAADAHVRPTVSLVCHSLKLATVMENEQHRGSGNLLVSLVLLPCKCKESMLLFLAVSKHTHPSLQRRTPNSR